MVQLASERMRLFSRLTLRPPAVTQMTSESLPQRSESPAQTVHSAIPPHFGPSLSENPAHQTLACDLSLPLHHSRLPPQAAWTARPSCPRRSASFCAACAGRWPAAVCEEGRTELALLRVSERGGSSRASCPAAAGAGPFSPADAVTHLLPYLPMYVRLPSLAPPQFELPALETGDGRPERPRG